MLINYYPSCLSLLTSQRCSYTMCCKMDNKRKVMDDFPWRFSMDSKIYETMDISRSWETKSDLVWLVSKLQETKWHLISDFQKVLFRHQITKTPNCTKAKVTKMSFGVPKFRDWWLSDLEALFIIFWRTNQKIIRPLFIDCYTLPLPVLFDMRLTFVAAGSMVVVAVFIDQRDHFPAGFIDETIFIA